MRVPLLVFTLAVVLSACASETLSPANVAAEPGGTFAVSFTRTFPPGFWDPGSHAYRLVITCPAQEVGPPVIRFEVSEDAPSVGTTYLRFDGPGRNILSPADLPSVNPDDTTVAVVTLAGMTETAAQAARADCQGTVVYDGLDPESLKAGTPFSP